MVRSKKQKEITIDDLAIMVARGFNEQDKKFSKEFSKVNKRFEQQELWINKRFFEQEQKFDKRFEELDKKYDNIMASIDRLAKVLETYYQEHLALGVKVDRHEEWIKKLAEHTGIKLNY